MFAKLSDLGNKSFQRYFRLIIIIIYNAINILIAVFLYRLIPIMLNYAPGIIRGRKENVWFGLSYTNQFVLIVLLCIFLGTIFLLWTLKGSNRWEEIINKGNQNEVVKIRKKCFQLPYMIYLGQLLFPVTILPLILVSIKAPLITTIKLVVIVFSFVSLVAVISLIFSKKLFLRLLLKTYKYNYLKGIKIGITTKIFLQIIPMIIVAILFTSLMGYSRLIEEKGDLLFKYYKEQLSSIVNNGGIVNLEKFQERLNKIKKINSNESFFIITPTKKIMSSDKTNLSKMFVNYINDLSDKYDGRVYNHSGDVQGAIVKLYNNGDFWIVGVKYEVASTKTIIFFLTNFIILLFINVFVLYYFSKSLSDDISLVAQNLNDLAESDEVNLDKKLPVTSNDEIGDLVIAFNKIQELEKENLRKLKERHEMLIQSERLAALGQMVGGIAHNLKTPIVSIAGGTEALKDLINEYQESVDDLCVTKEDHLEIAEEMLNWIKEIKSHCAYMSDIITAVREQAVQMNYSSGYCFTLEELVKRIEILMNYELKKYNCQIDLDVQVNRQIEIQGELNNLVQVFNNLINNAIQAYDDQGGKIHLKITTNQNQDLEFEIRDYGKGIDQEIRKRLFKEMVTTKGAKGTGMGLYMSYLTVKGKFGGEIWFESEENKGTAFHITIPMSYGRNDMEVS